MRILGLDPGEKRIGVAITDPLGLTAQGIDVIKYTRIGDAIKKIKDICLQYEVEKVIVGNPLNMDGSRGQESENAYRFAEKLRRELNLPVEMVDERLTSASAEKTLLKGNVSRKNRREVKDKLAATLILELYINTCQNQ